MANDKQEEKQKTTEDKELEKHEELGGGFGGTPTPSEVKKLQEGMPKHAIRKVE